MKSVESCAVNTRVQRVCVAALHFDVFPMTCAASAIKPLTETQETTVSRSAPGLLGTSWERLRQGAFSLTDQALSVGGMFLANVALARTVSKTEYGLFALSYSVFTFVAGLHNAALLEAYTVYGAGRYRDHHRQYAWLIWRSNAVVAILLTAVLVLAWGALLCISPGLASHPLLGISLTSGLLLTASLARRMFYVRKQPHLAARFSSVFFAAVVILLWICIRVHILSGLSAFLIVTTGWIAGGLFVRKELPRRTGISEFLEAQPNHWSEHWKYARWVLATAFVFQLTTQGYYWVVAGFLSLKQVAELKAMYMLVAPVEQVFTAVTLVILPMLAIRYASKQMKQFLALWKGYLLIFIAVSAVYVTVALFAGRPLIHLLYAGKFDDVAPLFAAMTFVPAVMGIGHTLNGALKAAERPKGVLYAYMAGGATTILAGVPLVMHFGLRGAIFGMLASGFAYSATLAIQFAFLIKGFGPGKARVHA